MYVYVCTYIHIDIRYDIYYIQGQILRSSGDVLSGGSVMSVRGTDGFIQPLYSSDPEAGAAVSVTCQLDSTTQEKSAGSQFSSCFNSLQKAERY